MPSDEDLIAERRMADEKTFLINATDPEKAERIAPAVNALRALLADRRWHPQSAALAAMLRPSDLAVRTADNMMRRAWAAGFLERRGEYIRASRGKKASDTREWRLIEWPEA